MTTKIPVELSSTPGISDSSDATAITIDSSENVGIGTTSPAAKLQIQTQTDGNAAFQNPTSVTGGVKINCFNNAANASSPFELDGSTLQFNIAASEKMRIDSSGNVGIGNTSPRQKLNVTGPLVSTGALATLGAAGSYTDGAFNATALDYYNDGARSWSWGGSSTRGTFNWYQLENDGQNQINSMQLDASGNLLFNSGFGSAGKAYGVRAWARFDGNSSSGTPSGGNVSSFTRTATGNFTINMTTAMPDTNYAVAGLASQSCLVRGDNVDLASSTTAIKIEVTSGNGAAFANADEIHIMVAR